MIKNLKYSMKKTITPILLAGITGTCIFSCSSKENTKENINNTKAYTLEQNQDLSYIYTVKTYDAEKAKDKEYEMKKIEKSYNTKCVPATFKNYIDKKNITWDDLKNTVEKTNFDEYHKNLLLKGINNLQKNNFNIDLSVINYNLKNIKIEYDNFDNNNVFGEFSCFEHKIKLSKNIKNKRGYDIVFLHEMLGHGMTDAYIEESKVYCSIDTPTYIIDENNKYIGYSLYGEAFTEATAQIIALTALDYDLCEEYRSGYDLVMAEQLMLCKDNNCELDEYANYGVDILIKKMKKNKIDNPYEIIAMVSHNLEESNFKQKMEISSDEVIYNYFTERIRDEIDSGTSFQELNDKIREALHSSLYNYLIIIEDSYNEEQIIAQGSDFIYLTKLYNDLGKYANEIINKKTK